VDRGAPCVVGRAVGAAGTASSCEIERAGIGACEPDPCARTLGQDGCTEPGDMPRPGAGALFDELDRQPRGEWQEEVDIEIVDLLEFDAIDERPFVAVPGAPATVRGGEDRATTEAVLPGGEDAARNEDALRPGSEDTVPDQEDAVDKDVRPRSDDTVGDEDADEPARAPDAFATLVAIMANVMVTRGASTDAASFLRALVGLERMEDRSPGETVSAALIAAKLAVATGRGLARTQEFAAQVLAWRQILSGESDDFSGCGSMALDEWAAMVVAIALGDGNQAGGIRRELRRYGVAAFGLVLETAAA
jgi:hypothetical protein